MNYDNDVVYVIDYDNDVDYANDYGIGVGYVNDYGVGEMIYDHFECTEKHLKNKKKERFSKMIFVIKRFTVCPCKRQVLDREVFLLKKKQLERCHRQSSCLEFLFVPENKTNKSNHRLEFDRL